MFNLSALLKRAAPPAAAELKEAKAALEADHAKAAAEFDALMMARERVYLDGSAAEIDAHADKITAADRLRDRLAVQISGLDKRIAEAEKAEAKASLDALYAEADQRRARTHELLKLYDERAKALVPILREIKENNMAVRLANSTLSQAGDPRRIAVAEKEIASGGWWREVALAAVLPLPGSMGGHWPPPRFPQ